MLRKFLVVMMLLGFIAAAIGVASALFTDSQTVASNSFASGTLDISTSPTSALVTFSNMAPGDLVVAPITVTNGGSLALRYAITSTATDADGKNLMNQLDLTIKSGVTDCSNAGFAADGVILYGPNDLGALTSTNLVGDPTTGADSGDRTLAAAGAETLCFSVSLPLSTGNAYQNAATDAIFMFLAEQTKNN